MSSSRTFAAESHTIISNLRGLQKISQALDVPGNNVNTVIKENMAQR